MRIALCIYIFLYLSITVVAQNKVGRVLDGEGKSVNGISIFIPELNQGILSDKEGYFKIITDRQDYTLLLKHPEYKILQSDISEKKIDIIIKRDTFYTDNLNIKADSIIKMSITKASAYSNILKGYKSYSYTKGRLTLEEVHSFIDKIGYKLDNIFLSDYKNKPLFQELYNETEYVHPNNYTVSVLGSSGDIPETITEKSVMEVQNGSIYVDRFGKFISPLSKYAFSFYKFKYLGYYTDGQTLYHKIQIESKIKDPELLNGVLYIEDGTWAIAYASLQTNSQGLESTINIAYNELRNGVSIPVSYHSNIVFSFIGTKGTIDYSTSIKYDSISEQEIIRDNEESNINKIEYEKNAYKRDSVFWNKYRSQPIDKEIILQYNTDSISSKRTGISEYWLSKALVGGFLLGSEDSQFYLKYNGVKFIFRDYNYVDGLWIGNKFDIRYKINKKGDIEAYPYIYYATARKRILAGSDVSYNYDRKRKGQLNLSFGTRSEDFSSLSLTRYQNYFSSLFLGENYNSFYQRDFISLNNSIHINKRLKLSTSFLLEKRSGLSNYTDFNLSGRKHIKPNIFSNDRFDRTAYFIQLYYSPKSNYSITEALEMHINKVTPVFNIEYQEGFSSWQTNNSKYQKIKGGVAHSIQLDYFNWIDYKIESGVYISKRQNLHFTDYQHFGSSDLLLNLNSLFDSFLLLDNYEIQTNRYWINLFLNYSGKYVCLKYIPFLQGTPFTENIHLKTLFTPEIKSYVETGYSISFNRYFGVGFFTSFLNTKIKNVGIRFSLNLRSLDIS
ncbi:conserved exported hypothetical protein [uncultured Dysgonomonas sp.]|uniref:Uncharacterized protein n=1 Tax=uncultured Dysgonomonas sp. TaxID=206096 RepID=A0A212K1Q8_9BACT|nr:DUF5686 family protein [uncultured Dysgonomonas sp.]SBW05607.1 conserved exported hypothetical protein [uncultured Dysgonomonas sp.]